MLKNSFDHFITKWLVGHEIHPYTNSPRTAIASARTSTLYTTTQNIALQAFQKALELKAKSFLHISPTGTGKTLVLVQALKYKLSQRNSQKISFVTVPQVQLVDPLYDIVSKELHSMKVSVINWNNLSNKNFHADIQRAILSPQPTVFVVTSQTLKNQLLFSSSQAS